MVPVYSMDGKDLRTGSHFWFLRGQGHGQPQLSYPLQQVTFDESRNQTVDWEPLVKEAEPPQRKRRQPDIATKDTDNPPQKGRRGRKPAAVASPNSSVPASVASSPLAVEDAAPDASMLDTPTPVDVTPLACRSNAPSMQPVVPAASTLQTSELDVAPPISDADDLATKDAMSSACETEAPSSGDTAMAVNAPAEPDAFASPTSDGS